LDKSIGIFDSGIGGLTVLKEIIKVLPHENTIYLGDTARVPYGTKSAPTIKRYALEDAQFLINHGIKIIVVACNTASANATSFLQDRFNLPIVEVIKPGAEKAAKATRISKVGVIGTEATIKSRAYAAHIKRINPDIEVFSKSCPLFVPLVEETWGDPEDESCLHDIKSRTVKRYLDEFTHKAIDTLVLGCTHYPLLKETIDAFMGEGVKLIDSAIETAQEVVRILNHMKLRCQTAQEAQHQYFVTDAPERFRALGTRFLGKPLERVEQIEIKPL
jgi:glutamate racemase